MEMIVSIKDTLVVLKHVFFHIFIFQRLCFLIRPRIQTVKWIAGETNSDLILRLLFKQFKMFKD